MKRVIPCRIKKNSVRSFRLPLSLLSLLLWLGVWQLAAAVVDNKIFLPEPALVFSCLIRLAGTPDYWICVGSSMRNILTGYLSAVAAGIILAWIAYMSPAAKAVISLPLMIIRAVPVASFIILALLWISSRHLSILISFLMVLPIVYTDILAGFSGIQNELLEMAAVFRMPLSKKITHIYLPSLSGHMFSALSTGAGLAWKSGIAAEVIGIARSSIGNRLYQSKIYLETPELFAWTITVIAISLVFEKLIARLFCLPSNIDR